MIGISFAATLLGTVSPVFSLNLDGTITSPSPVEWREGTKFVKTPGGVGLEVLGASGGWMMVDHAVFAMEKAITICAWLKPLNYNIAGPQAQIMLRGDDRSGLDPYSLAIHSDGTVFMIISDPNDAKAEVKSRTKLPINQWSHVLASFNATNHQLRIYVNGQLEGITGTELIPLGPLEVKDAAGLGVGNVQWDKGPHNQPYHGVLADLRLYNVTLEPKDVNYSPKSWITP